MPTKKAVKKTAKKKAPAKKAVVKKVSKKPAAKKTAKKMLTKKTAKKAAKKTNKKALVYANEETSFWVSNGQILNSLVALRDALGEMDKEVYIFHATGKNNDFANWVGAVLCDGRCAKDLEKAKTQKSAKTIVVRYLKTYSV